MRVLIITRINRATFSRVTWLSSYFNIAVLSLLPTRRCRPAWEMSCVITDMK